jgi:hypothetical protein
VTWLIAKLATHSVGSAIIIAHGTYFGHQSTEAKTLKSSPSDTAQAFSGHEKSLKYQSKKSMKTVPLAAVESNKFAMTVKSKDNQYECHLILQQASSC